MAKNTEPGPSTLSVHAGETPRVGNAVVYPIFQSATYVFDSGADYTDIPYIRLNNTPSQKVLHEKLCALEGAEASVVTSSGMSAISTALLSVLSQGDHLLVQNCTYGGTHALINHDLKRWGITHTAVDPNAPEKWADAVQPNTKAFYVETISNPLVRVPDLEKVAAFAQDKGLVSLIDNTFATPYNFRAAAFGFDLVLHSATKALNGHSDLTAGVIAGKAAHVDRAVRLLAHLGGSLDPHACFLLQRGIKTLSLRVTRQNQTALALARMLDTHPDVSEVFYPGLEGHPDYAQAKALLRGAGGVLSFELKEQSPDRVDAFMSRLKFAVSAPSLGGVETLITRPASTSHKGLSDEERAQVGVTNTLVRLSVGVEDTDDLCADIEQALAG